MYFFFIQNRIIDYYRSLEYCRKKNCHHRPKAATKLIELKEKKNKLEIL